MITKKQAVEDQDMISISCKNDYYLKAKMRELRSGAVQGMFKYEDKKHSVVHPSNRSIAKGENMIDIRGQLLQITEVVETRQHKGVYVDESKREMISIVYAIAIIFTLNP